VGRNLRRAVALAALLGSTALAGSAAADTSAPPVFVIGDGNAAVGTHVTFWGAQWAKDNSVSGGTAPSAFKGLALSTDATNCLFSSGPGNSVDPADALPAGDVAVLVASSIVKSGSTISGTFVGMVAVQPDPGYASDPGHAGTGAVVGVLSSCSGSF
jgi:hypothetical protein